MSTLNQTQIANIAAQAAQIDVKQRSIN